MELKFTKSTPLKVWLVLLAILAIAFMSFPGKAESGSITVSDQADKDYSIVQTCQGWDNGVDYSKFLFDTADYNTISWFNYSGGKVTYNQDWDTSAFTISSGGSGYGQFSFSKYLDQLKWVFSGNTTITSSTVVLSYSNPTILTEFAPNAGTFVSRNSQTGVSVNAPVGIYTSNAGPCGGVYAGIGTYHTNAISSTATNTYLIAYPLPGYFNLSVSKTGQTVTTKYATHSASNQSASYAIESTFNTANSNIFLPQGDGIYLNVSLLGGTYKDVLINSSGTPSAPTPPAGGQFNPPLTIPSADGVIQFEQTKYTVGDTVKLDWAISNSQWNCFVCSRNIITIIDSNGNQIDKFDAATQIGNKSYIATQSSTWTATYNDGFFTDHITSTAITTIQSQSASQILVNSTVAAGISFNVSYLFGFTPSFSGLNNFIGIEQLTNNGYVQYSSIAPITIVPLSANTFYIVSATIAAPGTYRISLYDQAKGKVASTTTQAVQVFIPIQINISNPVLTTDKPTYFFGDNILINYAVDNNNYSNYSQRYLAVKNLGNGLYTLPASNGFQSINLLDQSGNFELQIANTGDPSSCTTSFTCPIFSSITWYPGSTSIEMHVKNSTVDKIIAFANITLNQVDVNGDGLSISNTKVCTGNSISMNASTSSNATIKITLSSSTIQIPIVYDIWNFTGSGNNFKEKLSFVGNYQIQLIVNGITKFTYYVTVNDCATPTPTPGTTAPGEGWGTKTDTNSISHTVSQLDGYVGTMGYGVNNTTRFMFSVVVIILFIVFVLLATKGNGQVALATGFLPFSFFTWISFDAGAQAAGIEFIPKWPAIMFIILVALAVKVLR